MTSIEVEEIEFEAVVAGGLGKLAPPQNPGGGISTRTLNLNVNVLLPH